MSRLGTVPGACLAIAALAMLIAAFAGARLAPSPPRDGMTDAPESPFPVLVAAMGANGAPVPEPANTRVDAADPGDESWPDAAWLAESRVASDLVLVLVRNPRAAAATPVLRSPTFNPRDRWLAPSSRRVIAEIVAASLPAIERTVGEFEAVFEREFAAARNAGVAKIVDLTIAPGTLALLPLGVDPFYRTEQGTTWAVARSSLPQASEHQAAVRQLGRDLVVELAREFERVGALGADEVVALEARAVRALR